MKRISMLLIAAILLPSLTYSQGFFKALKKKAEDAGTDLIIKKTTKAASGKETQQPSKPAPPGNVAGTENDVGSGNIEAFSQYTFIPGEKELFADDFEGGRLGEFPENWFSNTGGEVVRLKDLPGKWIKVSKGSLLSPTISLPTDFACEFDVFINLPTVTSAVYPGLVFELFDRGDKAKKIGYDTYSINNMLSLTAKFHQKFATVQLDARENARQKLKTEKIEMPGFQRNYGSVVHVALTCRGEHLQLWLNAAKVFDLPAAVPKNHHFNQLLVSGALTGEGNPAFYYGNFRITSGFSDLRSTLLGTGRFTTTAIRFNIGSDQIRPESFGLLKELAASIKEHPSAKLLIIGHTDSDGTAEANTILSRKRALAVKDMLVKEFRLNAENISATGKGASEPVTENVTPLGKAKNRRVEFAVTGL